VHSKSLHRLERYELDKVITITTVHRMI
jgi:hypothetical protein